ncbi:MAG: ATP-binding cassette domain-containing protein [Spirochaetales bacterium]|nr:ATP-binding cassette domain-containing protein [Spirochaetales bacterium]
MIELKNISKSYDSIDAVKGVSFSTEKGQIFGLLGPNGAGKSTTIKMIMGILNPDSGEILFDGRPLKKVDKDKIGYLPEERGIYKKLTVREFILYFGMLKGKSRDQLDVELERWLTFFGLHEWSLKKTEELSKGMSQKVQFITSIIHDPDIVILDEPFSGLDPLSMDKLREAILILKDKGKTIIFSTHVMDQAEKICSDIVIINKGSAIVSGSLSKIKSSYGSNSVVVEYDGDGSFIKNINGVKSVINYPRYVEVELEDDSFCNSFLQEVVGKLTIRKFEKVVPSLHKIFINSVEGVGIDE